MPEIVLVLLPFIDMASKLISLLRFGYPGTVSRVETSFDVPIILQPHLQKIHHDPPNVTSHTYTYLKLMSYV